MSLITDVVIVTLGRDAEALAAVNGWLLENDHRQQQFAEVDTKDAGGDKAMGACIYAASFNYLDVEGLLGAITRAPWGLPWNVMVYVCREAESAFVMSPGRPGRWPDDEA